MKFAHDSLKLKTKTQNENFCFDTETAQGHLFAVLDFAPHDYANLNATLASKLETVAGSFASLSKFSADLFLGFLAREINNFLHHLSEQSSGPEIFCSAALTLVGGRRLHYLICGDVRIDITGGRLLSLSGEKSDEFDVTSDLKTADEALVKKPGLDRLGDDKLDSPLTDQVQTFDLRDEDVVLIMTRGLEAGFDRRQLPRDLVNSGSPEPKLICEALMKASASSRDDRTVVVIAGPYEQDVNPLLSDLTRAIASLEARLNTLAENEAARAISSSVGEPQVAGPLIDENARHDIEALKTELEAKAGKEEIAKLDEKLTTVLAGFKAELAARPAKDDLARLDEKLTTLVVAFQSKADSADVLGLKHDVSKLTRLATAAPAIVETRDNNGIAKGMRRPALGLMLLSVLLVGVGAAFLGAWLQSRMFRKGPEVSSERVSQPTATPTPAQAMDASQATPARPVEIAEVTVKPGDSLRNFAERYNVSLDTLKEMNPTIRNWNLIKTGQRINVPVAPSPAATPPPAAAAVSPEPASPSGTIEITVGPGDSLNRFAQRYNSTPQRLRELNPHIDNWASLRAGQKLLVPSPPG